MAERTEPIVPTHATRSLGHQRLLASLHLLPQPLCTAALRMEVLDPLQRWVG